MKKKTLLAAVTAVCLLFTGCSANEETEGSLPYTSSTASADGTSSDSLPSGGSSAGTSAGDGDASEKTSSDSSSVSGNSTETSSPDNSDIPDSGSSDNDSSDTSTGSEPSSSSAQSKPSSSSTQPKPSSSSAQSKPSSSSTQPKPSSSSPQPKPSSSSTQPKPSSTSSTGSAAEDPPVTAGGFYVDGTSLYDANGNEFIMRGINHAHVWYQWNLNEALDGIAKTGANCVRVVLADGDAWGKTSADDLKNVIRQCEQRRLVAVVEIHDATYGTAGDDYACLERAAKYWIEMKDILNEHTDTVIVNIANEWHNGQWARADEWADGYKKVIPMMRKAGIKNTLMVDCDGNGQYPQSLFSYANDVFDSDPLKNTMFSIHMYEYAGGDAGTVRSNIDKALATGRCTVIGEFGFKHFNGDVDEQAILDYCAQKGMGYIAWSWKGNGGGVEYLDLAYDWSGNSLSDWGKTVVSGSNGIKQTSRLCTVF